MNFLDLPVYPGKPRRRGATGLFDLFMPVGDTERLLEVASGVIDYVKFIHVGLAFEDSLPHGWLEEKLALYRSKRIKTYPGGVPYQVALVQDKVREFFDWLVAVGFDGVEIAEDAMADNVADEKTRSGHIKMALDKGLFVDTELGKKNPKEPLDLAEAADTIMSDVEMGVSRVAIERSELNHYMDRSPQPLVDLVNRVGIDKVWIEPNPFGWPKYHDWSFVTFGPDVCLNNIQPSEVMYVHLARIGFARFGHFHYFESLKKKKARAAANR